MLRTRSDWMSMREEFTKAPISSASRWYCTRPQAIREPGSKPNGPSAV